ncbi:uncharacterized protein LOC121381121 isoform X2 [Gigantopelta aegis]|uniref:uncharacterized protein LOC121381121 isoform X2 n=1 Tax=Gigantopelta aegis TaxID=1735272 RepID=UPI001B88C0DF|nr:uncharacterized protein LOC121381121 isoform X2 [Gigantopelta aegis]
MSDRWEYARQHGAMHCKNAFILLTGICAVLTLGMIAIRYRTDMLPLPVFGSSSCDDAILSFKRQRNSLSAQLNRMKQQFGMKSCELLALQLKGDKSGKRYGIVSTNGGWCKDESRSSSKSHIFDKGFADALANFFKGKKVASFGDGPGDYKKYIDKSQLVTLYDAYDGAPYCEETTSGLVNFLDLTAPQYGLPVYDWVMSVEVAEHIPAKYESVYLDNIFRHAQEGIVLSWAVPGQGGLSHVNLKSFKDVRKLLLDNGYELDPKPGEVLRNAAVQAWLKQNVYVYRRISKVPLPVDNA